MMLTCQTCNTTATGGPRGLRGMHEAPGGVPGVVSVRDTGIEPVTSSVSRKRATAAPIALVSRHCCRPSEVATGFEPVYTALQAAASPLGHATAKAVP